MKLIFQLFILIFLLTSCGYRSLEDFREDGEWTTRELIAELQSVHDREELIKKLPKLKKLFNELSDIMIAARQYQEKHPSEEEPPFTKRQQATSERLRQELNRIYLIDEGRELIEKAEDEALNKLDAFERTLLRRRQGLLAE